MKTTQHSKPKKYFASLKTLDLRASQVGLNDWVIRDNDGTQIAKVSKTSLGYAWQFFQGSTSKIRSRFQKSNSNGSTSVFQVTRKGQTVIH